MADAAEPVVFDVGGDFSLDDDAPEATKPRQAPDPKAQAQRFEQQVRAAANATAADMGRSVRAAPRIAPPRRTENPTEGLSTELRGEWQTKLMILSRYGASKTFGPLLTSYGFNLGPGSLKRMTLEQLTDELDRARVVCQNSTMEGMFGQAALSTVGLVETAVVNTPGLNAKVKLKGLTESLRQDQGFMTALEQCSIDYGCSWAVGPEYRLGMAFVAAAGRQHALNSFLEMRAKMAQAEEQEEGGSEGNDIFPPSAASSAENQDEGGGDGDDDEEQEED